MIKQVGNTFYRRNRLSPKKCRFLLCPHNVKRTIILQIKYDIYRQFISSTRSAEKKSDTKGRKIIILGF